MSEFSRNQDTEQMRRKHRNRVENARIIIGYLIDRHGIDPQPSRIPGQIGSVALPHDYEQLELPTAPHLTQPVLERTPVAQEAFIQVTNHGWDSMGNYL